MSKVDWIKLRPIILERLKQQPEKYPVSNLIPVANEVLKARAVLVEGVSNLLQYIPVKACRWCSEIHVGHIGHHIRSCQSQQKGENYLMHEWIEGGINDILIPVESFHLRNAHQNVIKHHERLKYERIPSIVELCMQAGSEFPEYMAKRTYNCLSENKDQSSFSDKTCDRASKFLVTKEHNITQSSCLVEELHGLARRTLHAWEMMRQGAQRLMRVYPVKVCRFCAEVHVGPIGHTVKLCGSNNNQALQHHRWKSARLNDLIPPQNVWHIRKHDVLPLLHEWKNYYGHAPAVVELCVQAGAGIPKKYLCMMKIYGLRQPSSDYLSFFLFVIFDFLFELIPLIKFANAFLSPSLYTCANLQMNIHCIYRHK